MPEYYRGRSRAYDDYDYDYPSDYRRGRGLNHDYYDDHPRRPRRNSSRFSQALEALEDGDFRGALDVVKPRSKSLAAPRTSHHHHSSSNHHSRRRYDEDDDYEDEFSPDRHRRHRSHHSSSDRRGRTRSRPRRESEAKIGQAAGAALAAGAVEAIRVRKEPGKWAGAKGARVATAAIGAAAIDAGIDRDPDRHAKRHLAESAVGGLLVNRLANGSKSEHASHHKHRSRRERR